MVSQDGATPHFRNETIYLLKDTFNSGVISRIGVNKPPKSSDLMPLDYLLWGYLKSQVHKNNGQSIIEVNDEMFVLWIKKM